MLIDWNSATFELNLQVQSQRSELRSSRSQQHDRRRRIFLWYVESSEFLY
jgi:hypothetical protein